MVNVVKYRYVSDKRLVLSDYSQYVRDCYFCFTKPLALKFDIAFVSTDVVAGEYDVCIDDTGYSFEDLEWGEVIRRYLSFVTINSRQPDVVWQFAIVPQLNFSSPFQCPKCMFPLERI